KITDIERLVIAAAALDPDPTNINGTNLVEKIYNSADRTPGTDSLTAQGINGPIFALIALDSQDFKVPSDARWTIEKLRNYLLDKQNPDGSWSLFGTSPSYDLTGMALIALALYKDLGNVKTAIDRAVQFLSS
ncbi:prenyltransferase/squalene oxidase repeat-containing protein, partial [Alkalihalophilus pseudofirmus]